MTEQRLAHQLMHHFEPHMRELGSSLVGLGLVHVYEMNAERAMVMTSEGEKKIHSMLTWVQIREYRSLMVNCNCSHFKYKGLCKHLWASILSVDGRSFSHGAPLLDQIDLILSESSPIDDNTLTEVAKNSAPLPVRAPFMHSSLHQLSRALMRERAVDTIRSTSDVKENQLWFELMLKEASENNIHITMHTRERTKSGSWSTPKVFNATKERLKELSDPADIRLAELLRKMTYWDNPNATMRANSRHKQAIGEISPLVFEMIFPLLTERGRLFITDHSGEIVSLVWRPKKIFRARLKVEKNASNWALRGEFTSNDITLSMSQVHPLWWGELIVAKNQLCPLRAYGLGPFFEMLEEKKLSELKYPDGEETRQDLRKFLIESVGAQNIAGDLEDDGSELGLGIKLREISPTPLLKLDISHTDLQTLITGFIRMEYQGVEMIPLSTEALPVREKDGHTFMRNLNYEAHLVEELTSDEAVTLMAKDVDPMVTIKAHALVDLAASLSSKGWILKGHLAGGSRKLVAPARQSSKLKTFEDWIGLQSELEYDGEIFDLTHILAKLKDGKYITLSDGSIGLVPEEWLKKQLAMAQLGQSVDGEIRIEKKNLPFLDILLQEIPETKIDISLAGLRENLKDWKSDDSPLVLPSSFKTELRAYQKIGLKWMQFIAHLGLGGCLADDMGLGKTVQVLALLESRRLHLLKSNQKLPTLVVLPKSLMPNWRQEAERFTPSMSVFLYEGRPSDRSDMRELLKSAEAPDVVLTTYGLVRQDINELSQIAFDYVILDEAQAIKNDQSISAQAVRELNAKTRLAITGTPVENGLDELFSLFHFLLPTVFGGKVIKQTLLKGNEEVTKNILRALRPFILRRTKAEVLSDLPEKTESILYCEMEPEQERFYQTLLATYKQSLHDDLENKEVKQSVHVLEAMLRLRQAACDPLLVDPHKHESHAAKHEVLLHKIRDIKASGSKALIFSQFTSHLKLIEKKLHSHHIKTSYLDGSTQNREEAIRSFKEDPDCTVFLISLKAGGFGLNLTEASYVFLMDPWWNPAVEAQAIDRIHRIGQKRPVFAYRIVTKNTIEEKVLLLQQEKRLIAGELETTDGSALKKMSMSDLNFLFS